MHNSIALNTLNLRVAATQCKKGGVGLPVNNQRVHQDLEAIMQGEIQLLDIGWALVPAGSVAFERPYIDGEAYLEGCSNVVLQTLDRPARYFQTVMQDEEYVVVIFDDESQGSFELPVWSNDQ